MKGISFLIFGILFFTVNNLNAQNTVERNIESFDKIDVFGNMVVEMRIGEKESLTIETLNFDQKEVTTKVKDKLLKIKLNDDLFKDGSKVKVIITYKELREITSNGSAEIKVLDEMITDKIFLIATNGGRIILKVNVNAIDIKAFQGGHIDIKGTCKLQESFVNTGGVLSASNFQCDEVFIKMNTGGQAEIIANKRIDANVGTRANLSFFGKPEIENLNTSLGGKITKWDED